ncbi:YjcZ family sporulation protein [Sporosarcina koreensis]|uniref:YjcZ family sporulation protein n=1 Tax=Sporosarcina koreensis TaxID=334735 RepID=A0ABW0TUZ3_9BACL
MSGVVERGVGYGNGFTLIVVLFILLIIVGAAFLDGGYC